MSRGRAATSNQQCLLSAPVSGWFPPALCPFTLHSCPTRASRSLCLSTPLVPSWRWTHWTTCRYCNTRQIIPQWRLPLELYTQICRQTRRSLSLSVIKVIPGRYRSLEQWFLTRQVSRNYFFVCKTLAQFPPFWLICRWLSRTILTSSTSASSSRSIFSLLKMEKWVWLWYITDDI